MPEFFKYSPDWQRGVSVESGFKTEIITSRLKREQRLAGRQEPRKVLEFELKLSRGDWADFQGFIAKNQQGRFYVTDWTEWVDLTVALAVLDDTMNVSSVPSWMEVGQKLYVVRGTQTILVEIAALGVGQVLMDSAMAEAVEGGARVYRVYDCTMDQSVKSKVLTSTAGQASMVFYVKPGTTTDGLGVAPTSFNGMELFLTKPNWSSEPTLELGGYMETVDFDLGVTDEYAPVAFNRRVLQSMFSFRDAGAYGAFYQFFLRQKGRRGEFYMPTGEPDLATSIGAAIGLNYLDTPGLTVLSRFGGSAIYRAAIVFFRDGTYQANRITGIADSGGNSRVSFEDPWATAVNDATARQVSFLPVWRFNTDDIVIDWLTNTVSQCQMTFATLEDLT
jgi:hypothetical protein